MAKTGTCTYNAAQIISKPLETSIHLPGIYYRQHTGFFKTCPGTITALFRGRVCNTILNRYLQLLHC